MQHITRYALLLALVLLGANAAQAQDPYVDNSPEWWNNLEAQLIASLDSDDPHIQSGTMQNIIYFQNQYARKVSFARAAPALLSIFENSTEEAYRVMALVTLHAIGEKRSMNRLFELMKTEASPYVRSLMYAAVADHYAPRSRST